MAGQPTMSGQDDYLSGQTFGLLVILTKHFNKRPGKKNIFTDTSLRFKRPTFLFLLYFLSVTLVHSSYYCVITSIYILTGEKRDVTELKFLSWVNMTDNNPKFILSPVMTNKPFTMISLCQCLEHTTCSPLRSCKILSFSNSAGPFPWPDLICNQYIRKVNFFAWW